MIIRALIFLIIGLYIFGQANAESSAKGFYIGAAYSSKWIGGTGTIDSKHFDIRAPIIDSIIFTEYSQTIGVRVITDLLPGYGLDSKYFNGFGLCMGYRFSKSLAISLSYDNYFTKKATELYSHVGLPEGNLSNHIRSFTYSSSYNQQDIQLLMEYHINRFGIFLSAGVEWIYSTLKGEIHNSYYIDNTITDEHFSEQNSYFDNIAPFVGLNYEYYIKPNISINCKTSFSFITFSGGLKLNIGIRSYIF